MRVGPTPLASVVASYLGNEGTVVATRLSLLGQEDSVKSNVYDHSRVVWRRARVGVVQVALCLLEVAGSPSLSRPLPAGIQSEAQHDVRSL